MAHCFRMVLPAPLVRARRQSLSKKLRRILVEGWTEKFPWSKGLMFMSKAKPQALIDAFFTDRYHLSLARRPSQSGRSTTIHGKGHSVGIDPASFLEDLIGQYSR